LPGSSIAWVHFDAERNYAAIAERAEKIIDEAVRALVGEGQHLLALNAAPHARAGVPAMGIGLPVTGGREVAAEEGDGGFTLDNGLLRAVITSAGQLASLVDAVTGRDAIAPGDRGNRLQLHRDIPNAWDAWDIDEHYRRTMQEIDGVEEIRLESKPEEAAVVVVRSFGASRIEQRLALAAGSPSLEITNTIDWHERQKLLKLGFELDVHADRSAAEIQFGHVLGIRAVRDLWAPVPACR
jgi:alpha-mannosidase